MFKTVNIRSVLIYSLAKVRIVGQSNSLPLIFRFLHPSRNLSGPLVHLLLNPGDIRRRYRVKRKVQVGLVTVLQNATLV